MIEKEIIINNKNVKFELTKRDNDNVMFLLNGNEYKFSLNNIFNDYFVISKNEENYKCVISKNAKGCHLNIASLEAMISLPNQKRGRNRADDEGSLKSPMPGQIFKILTRVGDKVSKGDPILILEAMKMEHSIKANIDGEIKEIFYEEGQLVDADVELAEIKPLNAK